LQFESLARQIKDAPFFEKTRIAFWVALSITACMDIALIRIFGVFLTNLVR
jgi:hypothetical protein